MAKKKMSDNFDRMVELMGGPDACLEAYYRIRRSLNGVDLDRCGSVTITSCMPAGSLDATTDADCAGADGAAPDVAQDDDDDGDGDGDPDSDRRRPRSKTPAPKPSSPPPPAALLTIAHTTHYVAAGRSRIYQMAADGQFPKPIKVGRSVRWIRAELDAWIAAQAARREVGVAQ